MPVYQAPERERSIEAKFIRVENIIFQDSRRVRHDVIANKEGILEEIHRLRDEKPDEVDAGSFYHFGDNPGTISLDGDSMMLRLPVVEEARVKSVTVFEARSPGFKIKTSKPFIYGK